MDVEYLQINSMILVRGLVVKMSTHLVTCLAGQKCGHPNSARFQTATVPLSLWFSLSGPTNYRKETACVSTSRYNLTSVYWEWFYLVKLNKMKLRTQSALLKFRMCSLALQVILGGERDIQSGHKPLGRFQYQHLSYLFIFLPCALENGDM
jgi:hypothetical protein